MAIGTGLAQILEAVRQASPNDKVRPGPAMRAMGPGEKLVFYRMTTLMGRGDRLIVIEDTAPR